ncbi:MAG: hypothetical protein E2604_10645 [Flavobacterium sp.]|nr:hypothetical protein [Flavobacterium sp.]
MNFEKLKSEWKRGEINDQDIPISVKTLKKSMHPLEQLKRNMKQEFYFQIMGIIVLVFFPCIFKLHESLQSVYFMAYSMLVVVSTYYLYSFYKFYKTVHQYEMDTKNSLMYLYYDLRLYMEKYKSFCFLMIPYGLICLALPVVNNHLAKGKSLDLFANEKILGLSVCLMIFTGIVMLLITTWVNFFYGKYIKQIKIISDELSE